MVALRRRGVRCGERMAAADLEFEEAAKEKEGGHPRGTRPSSLHQRQVLSLILDYQSGTFTHVLRLNAARDTLECQTRARRERAGNVRQSKVRSQISSESPIGTGNMYPHTRTHWPK